MGFALRDGLDCRLAATPMLNPPTSMDLLTSPSSISRSSFRRRMCSAIWCTLVALATCFAGAYLGIAAFLGCTRPGRLFSPTTGVLETMGSFLWDFCGMAAFCIAPGVIAGWLASFFLLLPTTGIIFARLGGSAVFSYSLLVYIGSVLSRM